LLDTIRDLPPYVFVMLGLYAGLRREEILALKWDCVFLDTETPYLLVRRAWHTETMNLRGGPNGRLVLFERSQGLKKQKKQYTTFLYSVVQSSAVLFKVSKNRHGESSVNNKLLKSLERPVGRRLPT